MGLGCQGARGMSGEVGHGLGLKGRAVGGPGGLPEAWQRAIGQLGRRGAGQLGDPTRRGEGENLKGWGAAWSTVGSRERSGRAGEEEGGQLLPAPRPAWLRLGGCSCRPCGP